MLQILSTAAQTKYNKVCITMHIVTKKLLQITTNSQQSFKGMFYGKKYSPDIQIPNRT